ncbi:MAG: outer membrane beta-barrel protein [Deltaproteobacteria bacterium]|nr:outer membrane beta-barrel protein [Deltaproteobacteria bacterium]
MRTMRKAIVPLLATALLLPAAQAVAAEEEAEENRFHDVLLTGGLLPAWVHDDSLGPFSDDDVMMLGQMGVEVFVGQGFLVGLGYAGGVQKADVFAGAFDSRLELHEVPVLLRYRYPVFDWLHPYARLGIGPTFARASLAQKSWGGDRLRQWAYGMRGSLGLGAEFLLPRRLFRRSLPEGAGGFTMGFALEAGYAYRLPLGFHRMRQPAGSEEDFEDQLPQGAVDLGTLKASGVYWSLDLVLHF